MKMEQEQVDEGIATVKMKSDNGLRQAKFNDYFDTIQKVAGDKEVDEEMDDWLDVLKCMAKAGVNVAQVQHDVLWMFETWKNQNKTVEEPNKETTDD